MSVRAANNEYRTTMVYIESYNNQNMTGYMDNQFVDEPITFDSTMQFILKMESLLDEMKFPQTYTTKREFTQDFRRNIFSNTEKSDKIKASFAIKIMFRQNTSWQGSIIWLDGDKDESFRSVLELLLLMHSALSSFNK